MSDDDHSKPLEPLDPDILEFVDEMRRYKELCTSKGRDEELKLVVAFIRSRAKELHLTNLFDLAHMLERRHHRK
jgi:hypothetical protein